MKTYGGVEVQLQTFLTSTLDGGEWSGLRPGRFTPGERTLRDPCYRRLVGPKHRSGRGGE